MKDNAINVIRQKLGYRNSFNFDPDGIAGGLSLWWNDDLDIQILSSSKNVIDTAIISRNGDCPKRITWVYSTLHRVEKDAFWRNLEQLSGDNSLPWLCAGDFNEILWGFEKSGGHETSLYRPQYLMNFMDKIGLIDLGFQGQSFTWRKNRSERGLVQEQLDRDLINCSWQEAWPNSTVTHCPAVGSDHCPLVIDSSPILKKDEEIDIATKEIGALKSLGPDGFQGLFYHTYWVLIRNEVRGAVHEFFRGEVALDKFNSTNIALIPKVPNPEVVSHFCPISCCNFSYKIFAKVLANRFKPILEQVITHHQSAFMPNRQIQDNVIMLMRFFIT
ncbi:unnamed protein product [Prunus armeniaca]|uniref:Uncharacterized protein n=1 Tax=Prunus armeniaca TaxID=36596 RepID=A0A6J5TKE3_PRUAR|nr:unnamed protein product [Prunus armeniaca]